MLRSGYLSPVPLKTPELVSSGTERGPPGDISTVGKLHESFTSSHSIPSGQGSVPAPQFTQTGLNTITILSVITVCICYTSHTDIPFFITGKGRRDYPHLNRHPLPHHRLPLHCSKAYIQEGLPSTQASSTHCSLPLQNEPSSQSISSKHSACDAVGLGGMLMSRGIIPPPVLTVTVLL